MLKAVHPPSSAGATEAPTISADLLRRMDVPGPRYTSYPTADRFVDAFTAEHYEQALRQRAGGAMASAVASPLSVYVHVPFCESVCYYCACNKVVTRDHGKASPYLDALRREIRLHTGVLGECTPVSQLHFGGGTPTFLSDAELEQLMAALRAHFALQAGGEYSIEVDPRTVDRQRLARLAALGFNRISFGVQDFDPAVQRAVHRIQPYEQVRDLMHAARDIGFESVNVDLIYGLPLQSAASFQRTVNQVVELRPDRIAVYGYAHLPARFKPQRRIDPAQMPTGGERIGMLAHAIEGFIGHGYVYIGMDHFALPNDALAVAKRQGRLHRNFQGYSTQSDCDLIGLGVSAIGKVGATFSQNAKTLPEYYDALERGRFPVVRGLALTRDDLLRRAVISAIMCHGRVNIESIELAHLIDFKRYFRAELETLRASADDGFVTLGDDEIVVTPLGWYFVRSIAMVFDKYLQADHARERFSKVI
jgi:oxygen-independent coproporphyrinogen III oxidase